MLFESLVPNKFSFSGCFNHMKEPFRPDGTRRDDLNMALNDTAYNYKCQTVVCVAKNNLTTTEDIHPDCKYSIC